MIWKSREEEGQGNVWTVLMFEAVSRSTSSESPIGSANQKVNSKFLGVPEVPRNFSKSLRITELSMGAETVGGSFPDSVVP